MITIYEPKPWNSQEQTTLQQRHAISYSGTDLETVPINNSLEI